MLLRYQNSRNQLVDICQICIDSLVVLVMEIIRIVYPVINHAVPIPNVSRCCAASTLSQSQSITILWVWGATVLLLSHYTTKDVLNLWLSFPNICLNFY